MYKVYIQNYKSGDSIVTEETLMFSVPGSNFPVSKPNVKNNEDTADVFTFTMDSNSQYYDAMLKKKTLIRVEFGDTNPDIIFFGRVLSISTSSVYQTKNVACEGCYTFLNDTYYEGKQEKHRSNITVEQYFTNIINNHNNMAPDKSFIKGTIGVTLPSDTDKYEPTAWTQSLSLLSNLSSNYGGHINIRYSGQSRYVDWYKYYVRDLGDGLRPKVIVGKNILDISSDSDSSDIFTWIIPIGDTDHNGKPVYVDGYEYTDKNGVQHAYSGKSLPVSIVRELYTDEQLTDEFHDYKDYRDAESNYGIIYKPVTFSDAKTPEKLWELATKWIKDCYFGSVTSFTVKAIDMHFQDNTQPRILKGDCVDVTFLIVINGTASWVTKKLVCRSVQYDLFNPDNNSYTFGVPSDLLDHNKNNKKSSKDKSVSGSSNHTNPKGNEDEEITWRKVWQMIGTRNGNHDYEGTNAAISFYNNGELTGTITCYDTREITDGDPRAHRDKWFTANILGKITLSGKPTKWVAFSSDRGVFAYQDVSEANPVTHWYSEKKGYKYTASEPGLSSFETIAKLIENDSNATYGGTTNADSFRSNGNISGSVKCYDPDMTSTPLSNPECIFTAKIVGRFLTNMQSTVKYVAISDEYGIFAYTRGSYPSAVAHWYHRAKGITYNNVSGFIATENIQNGDKEIFTTDDNSPDGKKTIYMKPVELTGQGSKGQAFIGYDLTAPGDKWRIGLNKAIQYLDENNVSRIADGFVSASDFNLESIPSFKTKLAVVDILIAGKVSAVEIEADLAYLRKIEGNAIIADTGVRSDKIWANTINATTYSINVPSEGGSGYDRGYLNYCFSTCNVSSNNGVITLDFGYIGGGHYPPVNFNIADTQFFKDQVAAAKASGRASVYGATANGNPYTGASLNPGGSSTVYLYYKDENDIARYLDKNYTVSANTDSNLVPINIKKDVTIFGVTGSYDVYGADSNGAAYSDTSLNPGGSSTVYLYYKDENNNPVSLNKSYTVSANSDSNLTAGNIKKDVTIFGVTGTYAGSSPSFSWQSAKCYATTSTSPQALGDDEQLHNCVHIKDLGTISSDQKSIRVIFKIGTTEYFYYFSINRDT